MDPINVGILEEIAHAGNKEEKQKTWNTKKMAQHKAEPLRTATAWEREKNQQDIADMIQANANIYLVALKALSMLEANASNLKKVIRNLKAKGADTTSAEAMLQETRQNMEKENAFHYEHIS